MRLKLYIQRRNWPQKNEWLVLTKLRDSTVISMALQYTMWAEMSHRKPIRVLRILRNAHSLEQSVLVANQTIWLIAGKLVNAVSPQTSTNPNSN